jgi:hypothetical protein
MVRLEYALFDDASQEAERANGGVASSVPPVLSPLPTSRSQAESAREDQQTGAMGEQAMSQSSTTALADDVTRTSSGLTPPEDPQEREEEIAVSDRDEGTPTTFVEPGAVETLAAAVASVDAVPG